MKIRKHDGTRESITILFLLILTVSLIVGFII